MNKILLTTLFSGYNYGSSLQAFATKCIIEDLGYDCELVARKSLVKGRNVSVGKTLTLLWRTLLTVNSKSLMAYKNSFQKLLIGNSACRFDAFERQFLQPKRLTWRQLKNEAKHAVACVAGSDQLWDTTSLYIDPLYYLRFAAADKRISFATSMGHVFVSHYNEKKLKKWINQIRFISVREDSGVRLIRELCGREALHLPDPSLLLDGDMWRSKFNLQKYRNLYILAYFLDAPSEKARECIRALKDKLKCEVIAIPYEHEDMSYADKVVPTGPVDFLSLVDNASVVVTDSFHGTAFSINLHTPFFVFDRNYGVSHSQSSRVKSLLSRLCLADRFEISQGNLNNVNMSFSVSDKILRHERSKALEYLRKSIETCN